ncbi:MAG: FAD-binding oxidoreductase [Collinsella sp.]|nr:FAD-binding oxidoreductase [Collinsella sp.]
MRAIKPMTAEFDEYRHDESRNQGEAETISFPTGEEEVRAVIRACSEADPPIPVTIQGARTGLAAGAVPCGGHVLNLSRMNAYLGLRQDGDGTFRLRVQPGVILSELRRHLHDGSLPAASWDEASRRALERMKSAPEQIFPTDPTETSACLGGMAACNASGARSYRHGPMRPHVSALRVVLASGEVVALRRGEMSAQGRSLELTSESGSTIALQLPEIAMPRTKNASGYFIEEGMDAIDLFIGSDGTLGVITELELDLIPAPRLTWGVSCFLPSERAALDLVVAARPALACASAIEYLDGAALQILRSMRSRSAAFASLPAIPSSYGACVFIELACEGEDRALGELESLGRLLAESGGDMADTWVARTDVDRERQRFFRHAVPESVNMLIDERRRIDPGITKLGSDMSVPNDRLHDVMELYRGTIAEAGLQSAAWGHIGDNHLHVNILPRDASEHAAGEELFHRWAGAVTEMGGAVSAEHGIGKIKRDFLLTMYGEEGIDGMALLKAQLDPAGILGRGNLFDEARLQRAIGRLGAMRGEGRA